MLKSVSILLIVFASFCVSRGMKKTMRRQNQKIEELCEFIDYCENQVRYFNLPTDEILAEYANSGFDFFEISELDFLSEKAEKALEKFTASFGKNTREEQLAVCEYTKKILAEFQEYRNETQEQKVKTYSCLFIVAGMLFAILII